MKSTNLVSCPYWQRWLAMGSLFLFSGCGAQSAPTVPADWITDCVGRMQISLPGRVDVAAYTFDRFKKETAEGSQQQRFEFFDANTDGHASTSSPSDASHAYLYYSGLGFVSHPLTDAQFSDLSAGIEKIRIRTLKTTTSSIGKKIQPIPIGDRKGIAWSFGRFYRAFLKVGDSAFLWMVSFDVEDEPSATKALNNVLSGLVARPTYSVPSQDGVCVPYAFIADDGQARRNLAMTYRLVDHPEIQITIKDASAANPPPGNRTQNAEPLPVIQSLWDQHLTLFAKDGKNEWARGGHPVTLAGYKGLSSFVKFIRHDDAVDYGYAAVVRGDPHAKEDTPDLMVYVIRDSHNAKGKEPMPKDEFLKMAETIAASVKRRPVQ